MVVHQGLHLGGPIGEILYFVKEYKGQPPCPGLFVESTFQDSVFKPAAKGQNRVLNPSQGRNFVKLDAKDVIRRYSFLLQKMLYQLFLQGSFSDLPGASEDGDRGQPGFQPLESRFK
jgi:hypothetical protein